MACLLLLCALIVSIRPCVDIKYCLTGFDLITVTLRLAHTCDDSYYVGQITDTTCRWTELWPKQACTACTSSVIHRT